MKRLFVAINIKPESDFLAQFDELKHTLKHEKIKWVKSHNLHLTLKFFGETEEDKIPGIINAIELALKLYKKASIDISTLGVFGSSYKPKVVWAGISNAEPIIELEKSIKKGLEEIGFSQDSQNFVPHLSLGRIKFLSDKKLFQDIISKYKNEYFQKVLVKDVFLLESILRKEGPIYKIVKQFELK